VTHGTGPAAASLAGPVLRVRGLTKRFDGIAVVDDVSFEVHAGEVVGLVGQNGSGKSTTLKLLARFHNPDEGSFEVGATDAADGEVTVGFVHQDLGLVPSLTVTENLALGRGYPRRLGPVIDWPRAHREARDLLAAYGIRARPDTVVEQLSLADRTLLAIGRALLGVGAAKQPLLVLDEATSSLSDREVDRFLDAIVRIARDGGSVIFVSHRLDEVLRVADRVLVMRDGRLVADEARAELTRDGLVARMLGRQFARIVSGHAPASRDAAGGPARLHVEDLSGRRLVDFTVRVAPGEIVGVTGLLGSGKSELARILAGAQVPAAGRISIDGAAVTLRTPRDAIRAGIGYVPPDRRTQGGVHGMTATENLTLPDTRSFLRPFTRLLDDRAERAATLDWMTRAGVRPRAPRQQFETFSGGNQQKLVYGRWIRLAPRILVLDEPTRGVDVSAVADLYDIIRGQASEGAAVVLMSSEWEELPEICHRVIVLDRGRTVAELAGPELTVDNIAAVAFGHSTEQLAS
jgi:ribose transport system ATP-binding protein